MSALPTGGESDLSLSEIIERVEANAIQTVNVNGKTLTLPQVKTLTQALAKNTSVTWLDMFGTDLKDTGAAHVASALRSNQSVNVVYLMKNNIGNKGAIALSHALARNNSVSVLYLGCNSIGNAGAQAFSETLKENTSLSALYLQMNKISSPGAHAIAQSIKSNTSLTELDLSENKIDKGTMEYVTSVLTGPRVFYHQNVERSEMEKELIKVRDNASDITSLDYSDEQLDESLAHKVASSLLANTYVTTLTLSSNYIGDEGADYVGKLLRKNNTLTDICLCDNDIGPDGAQALATALKTNRAVITFDLSMNRIGDDGAKALASALESNHTLKTMLLWENDIDDPGALHLLNSCKSNGVIQRLDIQSNNVSENVMESLETVLDGPRAIVSTTGYDHVEVNHVLQEMVANVPSRTDAEFCSLELHDQQFAQIAHALGTNHTVLKLDISDNLLTPKGAKYAARALRVNKVLTHLNFSGNSLGAGGAYQLGSALRTSTTLRQLSLGMCDLGDAGARYIAEMLMVNKSLIDIGMAVNDISDVGGNAFLRVLGTKNKTLFSLRLDGNPMSTTIKTEIMVRCTQNRETHQLLLAQREVERAEAAASAAARSSPISPNGSSGSLGPRDSSFTNMDSTLRRVVKVANRGVQTAFQAGSSGRGPTGPSKVEVMRLRNALRDCLRALDTMSETAAIISYDGMLCYNCEATSATEYCVTCGYAYCLVCVGVLHKRRSRREHQIVSFDSGDRKCVNCEDEDASVACIECCEVLCAACDRALHQARHSEIHERHTLGRHGQQQRQVVQSDNDSDGSDSDDNSDQAGSAGGMGVSMDVVADFTSDEDEGEKEAQ